MSDFVQTMKNWRRMCQFMDKEYGNSSCDKCPLGGCSAVYDMCGEENFSNMEHGITAWAAEHPKPMYETWGQYFRRYYGLEYCKGHEILLENIPADIAQKLGLQPQERV